MSRDIWLDVACNVHSHEFFYTYFLQQLSLKLFSIYLADCPISQRAPISIECAVRHLLEALKIGQRCSLLIAAPTMQGYLMISQSQHLNIAFMLAHPAWYKNKDHIDDYIDWSRYSTLILDACGSVPLIYIKTFDSFYT